MKWVSPAPNLSGLEKPAADAIRKSVARNATALRQIYRRTAVAKYPSEIERNLAMSIEGHAEKAAADIQSKNYGAAIWETHLGIEKILKVFLRQATGGAAHSHDLTKLIIKAEQAGLPSSAHLNLDKLPSHDDANKHRYAEIPAPSFEQVMEFYEIAILAIAHVAGSLTPGPFAEYGDLYIQALPWSAKWKQSQLKKSEDP